MLPGVVATSAFILSTSYLDFMALSNIFQIAAQGMTAQRERLEVATANLANANTTRTVEGGVYRRRDVVLESVGLEQSGATNSTSFGSLFDNARTGNEAPGVRAITVVAAETPGIKRFDPGHPDADADGYVTLPDVDPLEETVNMLSAARAFEANATVFNTAKEMARTSLKLGDA